MINDGLVSHGLKNTRSLSMEHNSWTSAHSTFYWAGNFLKTSRISLSGTSSSTSSSLSVSAVSGSLRVGLNMDLFHTFIIVSGLRVVHASSVRCNAYGFN